MGAYGCIRMHIECIRMHTDISVYIEIYIDIYIYTYADGLSLITPSHPQGASERSFFDKSASGGFASVCMYIFIYINIYWLIYIYIYISNMHPYASVCIRMPPYALFTPPNANIQHTRSPKKSKNQKIDEFDFSIMRSGAQNRSEFNPMVPL